jgi:hypothetical protein
MHTQPRLLRANFEMSHSFREFIKICQITRNNGERMIRTAANLLRTGCPHCLLWHWAFSFL